VPGRILVALLPIAVAACGQGQGMSKTAADGSPQAISATPAPNVAVRTVGGVRLYARGDAWEGSPANLGSTVTPLAVRIENHSGGPIELLPLSHPSPAVASLQPTYRAAGFFIAPRFARTYPRLPVWQSSLVRDESLYRLDYRKWSDGLPSADVLLKGLPEGILQDGGSISGFLYFDGEARGQRDLTLQADLPAGDGERRVALIEIPFRIQ
jgi:hypothetical protein